MDINPQTDSAFAHYEEVQLSFPTYLLLQVLSTLDLTSWLTAHNLFNESCFSLFLEEKRKAQGEHNLFQSHWDIAKQQGDS